MDSAGTHPHTHTRAHAHTGGSMVCERGESEVRQRLHHFGQSVVRQETTRHEQTPCEGVQAAELYAGTKQTLNESN